jgi:hypothetical protein
VNNSAAGLDFGLIVLRPFFRMGLEANGIM